jgi:hypothetical protein
MRARGRTLAAALPLLCQLRPARAALSFSAGWG